MLNDKLKKIVALAKRRGFVYPSSAIYGGLANTWDFGPRGAELKKNVKDLWWKKFVENREDILGLDSAILMNPQVWQASGHLQNFTDPLIECKKCHQRFRADHLITDNQWSRLAKQLTSLSEVDREGFIQDQFPACPNCGVKRQWTIPAQFNLMFKTFIGPKENTTNIVYLRPETAQGMFVNFKNILDTMQPKLPFGIAQIGKAFRNEITPGNFIFRVLEFEQMEIEYFIKEADWRQFFDNWQAKMEEWLAEIGIKSKNYQIRNHKKEELSHYSKKTIDIEYKYPFGYSELYGLAYRTDYDLKAHQKVSGQDLTYRDQISGKRIIPHVIEPTFGVERTVLALLCEAYTEESDRVVLKFRPTIAPVKIAIFPLLRNKPELVNLAKEIFNSLKTIHTCEFDDNGNIGKRYRRQDEIGTPFCVTVDFNTLKDKTVTVRDRDSMKQTRIRVDELSPFFRDKV